VGDTPKATIEAAIAGYRAGEPVTVLAEFDDDATIVGTKQGEKWKGKSDQAPARGRRVEEELAAELDVYEVDGDLAYEQVDEDDEIDLLSHEVAVFTREGTVNFNEKKGKKKKETVHGRWTAVLKADGEHNWSIVHSHFSLSEGYSIPEHAQGN